MTEEERSFIRTHRVARLATVDAGGQPHVVPIVYAFDGQQLYTPIDAKPKRVEALRLQRVRNIQANPQVALVVDEYSEEWSQLAWVQIRGIATLLEDGATHARAVDLLHDKYPQYTTMPLDQRPIIAITPTRVLSWQSDRQG